MQALFGLKGYEDFVEPKRRCNFVNWESTVKSITVIRRNDAIVCPHLQSKIQESLEDRGTLLVDPPSRSSARTQASFLVGLLSSQRLVIRLSFDCSGEIILPSIF